VGPFFLRSLTLPAKAHMPFNYLQVLAVTNDNSSVFVPGGRSIPFRWTDIIAGNSSSLVPVMETGVSVFYFSHQRRLGREKAMFKIQLGGSIYEQTSESSCPRLSFHQPYHIASPERPRFPGSRLCFECLVFSSIHNFYNLIDRSS
jgi:hypothetical protein